MPWTIQEASDIGGRSEQQDRSLILASEDGLQQLLVVADGAGGHLLGGQAAQVAIDTIYAQAPELWASEDPISSLEALCHLAHQAVCALTDGQGIACTTVVIVLVRGADAYWVHAGDSKFHLVRDGKCFLTTKDHSLLQLHLDQLEENPDDEALKNDKVRANQLYMCLGAPVELEPPVNAASLKSGDVLLLSSDGFWGQVDIPSVLLSCHRVGDDPQWSLNWVEQAREKGGERSDNITLVAALFSADEVPGQSIFYCIKAFFRHLIS
jgi:PPM family protein phosphatase